MSKVFNMVGGGGGKNISSIIITGLESTDTITCTKDGKSYTATWDSAAQHWEIVGLPLGTFTVTATNGTKTITETVLIDIVGVYEIQLTYIVPIRYIKTQLQGSSVNQQSHFVEVQAIDIDGNNVLRGITPTVLSGSLKNGNISYVTDGLYGNAANFAEFSGTAILLFDIGCLTKVECIKRWHYYTDGRTYYYNVTSVSADGETWTDVFNSEVDGRYAETAEGKTVYL